MTGRDLVAASLRLIGAVAPGESIAASEATDGLASLNRMIGSWSNEQLLIYAEVREQFTLTAGDGQYTMGDDGDFDTTRPISIKEALIRDTTVSPVVETPLRVTNLQQRAEIPVKTTQSSLPAELYADGGYPLQTLLLYPVPSVAHALVIYSLKPLTEIATLDTSVSFPPGYDRALIYNLAIELAPEYGKVPSQQVMVTANEAKTVIQRTNHRTEYLKVDEALMGQSGGFDIYTGGYR
jgi:hypothetical protein